jgi:hypothetical protein
MMQTVKTNTTPLAGSRMQSQLYAVQECLRSAIASIRAHGLRSFLTMLGIIIGVSSVICVIALVQGLSQSISQQFEGLGSNTLTLRSETPFEDVLRGKRNRLRPADLEQLKFRVEVVKCAVVPMWLTDSCRERPAAIRMCKKRFPNMVAF